MLTLALGWLLFLAILFVLSAVAPRLANATVITAFVLPALAIALLFSPMLVMASLAERWRA